ncbi:hypothetical protein DITRI_Ditri12bG0090200 [Diplodiscus trichospermus]
MKYRKFFSIPIVAVLLLMGFVYYITVFIFIEDWVGLQSSAGYLNAMIFSLLASLCLFSFFVGVLTDSGNIPSSYLPDVEDSPVSDQEPKKNDHHCLWINNCVGYWNYKAFFNLILYATMGSIHSAVIVISCSFQKDWNYSGRTPLRIFYIACGAMMLALCATLGTLLVWHIYLVSHNMTTIEYYEGVRAAWLAKKSGLSYRHPFDHSVYKNITLVLGPNMLRWLWPTAISHLKDGISFTTSRDSS